LEHICNFDEQPQNNLISICYLIINCLEFLRIFIFQLIALSSKLSNFKLTKNIFSSEPTAATNNDISIQDVETNFAPYQLFILNSENSSFAAAG